MHCDLAVVNAHTGGGGKIMKALTKEHNVQLDIDPVTWEPVGDRPAKDPAVDAT